MTIKEYRKLMIKYCEFIIKMYDINLSNEDREVIIENSDPEVIKFTNLMTLCSFEVCEGMDK